MNPWKLLCWLVLGPLFLFGGCHMFLTGSPIPLWHLESLDNPIPITAISEDNLVVQDGRTITRPFITKIPHDNPFFKTAIANGVEVTKDGELFGLMWVDERTCGNDPT